jgi:hypothetical protein
MSNYFQNQNQNDSAILNLESLTKQYDTTLIQYNQVQSDYINVLESQKSSSQVENSGTTSNLVSIPNSTFWGTKGISSSNVSSVSDCSALCSKTPGCSGATYNVTNNNQNNCWLTSGDGSIITGTTDQFAIITQDKKYLKTLEQLNIQLINFSDQIMEILKTNKNVFLEQDEERFSKYDLLKENYEKLEEERKNILEQLLKYQTIEEKQNQGELIVTRNYYNYVLLLVIALICVFILSRTAVILISENVSSSSDNNLGLLIATISSCFIIFLFYYFLF